MSFLQSKNMQYILVLLTTIAVISSIYLWSLGEDTQDVRRAKYGDTTVIQYTGYFEDDRIFDTNVELIAGSPDYPKSSTFTERDVYEPLTVTIGEGRFLPDFEMAIIDMAPGETKTITIPAERGYGLDNNDLIVEINITEYYDIYEQMTVQEFNQIYGDDYNTSADGPPVNMTFQHWVYGWDLVVVNVTTDRLVTIRNKAVEGLVEAFPWDTHILYVDEAINEIKLQHSPSVNDVLKKQYDNVYHFTPGWPEKPHKEGPGIVIDVTIDTFTINYNREVTGDTLMFDLTLLSIEK